MKTYTTEGPHIARLIGPGNKGSKFLCAGVGECWLNKLLLHCIAQSDPHINKVQSEKNI